MSTETKFKLDQTVLIKHPSVADKNLTGVIDNINNSTSDGSTAYRVLVGEEKVGFWYLEQYLEAAEEKVDLTQLALDNLKKMWEDLRRKYAEDMSIISERLIMEAESRGWCSEFDEIIEEVNNKLQGPFPLDTREKDIEVEVTVRGTVWATTTVTVRAANEDKAAQMIADDPDSYFDANEVLTDHVNGWGFDDVDWEITE